MNVQLVINGQKFPVHYRHLLAIAEHLPADGAYSREVAKALVSLGVPSIAMSLINSSFWASYTTLRCPFSSSLLTQQDLDELWAEGDPDIRRSLAININFVCQLTDSQARDIIMADDPEMLEVIAANANLLYPALKGLYKDIQGKRLSRTAADALLEHIAGSRYPKVRQALAESWNTPFQFRPAFRECVASGFRAEAVLVTIQPEDIELLKTESVETLQDIARHVEDIRNKRARLAVIKVLCAHPDPSVRMALAQNRYAPTEALRFLARDAEAEVRLIARKLLYALGIYVPNQFADAQE